MRRRGSIRPGKANSMMGFITGIIFCFIGLFVVIPSAGAFGVLWTLIAVVITVTNAMNAFTEKGVPTQVIEYEDDSEAPQSSKTEGADDIKKRLETARELYESGTITYEEYEEKRKELLEKL